MSRWRAWPLAPWLALGLYGLGNAIYVVLRADRYLHDDLLLGLNAAAAAAGVYAFAIGLHGLVHDRAGLVADLPGILARGRTWRFLAYLAFGAFAATLAGGRLVDKASYVLRGTIGGAALLVLATLALRRRLAPLARSAWLRRLDLVAANLLLTLLLAEGSLHVVAALGDWPILMRYDSDAKIEGSLEPGKVRDGFRNNSRGFYDHEFTTERIDGVARIVALGDSFAAGIVPYRHNVMTVLEERLDGPDARLEVYNMGIGGTDPSDYRYLYLVEGMTYQPDLVVVLFYMGNDYKSTADPSPLDPNFWYVYFIPYRLLAVAGEARRQGRLPAVGASEETTEGWVEEPFHADWRLEEPSFSLEGYMGIEASQLKYFPASGGSRKRDEAETFEALADLFRAARSRPGVQVALVSAPTEFMVDDEQYRELLEYHGFAAEHFDLTEPARNLAAFCRAEDIPYLDLTPALREGHARLGRVYHRRDMHWNAGGNRVAAEAMAAFLEPMLDR